VLECLESKLKSEECKNRLLKRQKAELDVSILDSNNKLKILKGKKKAYEGLKKKALIISVDETANGYLIRYESKNGKTEGQMIL
jgi:hypothetical protein